LVLILLRREKQGIVMQTGYALRDVAQRHVRAPVQETSDETLIQKIANGDKRAMQLLYARHNVRVYRFILRLTANQSLAEDLVSDVFLDVWRQAQGFEAKSQVSTWLLAIARYKALSALRRRMDEPLDDQMAATIEDTADNPETTVGIKDRNIVVQKCLTQLSPAHREVIDLVYYHEKSVDEVSRIVGVPPATVKTRMFYARSKMADLLKQAGVSAL
jgi:RNA polymerase sigma-70 factor (ECF subfamily)